MPRGIQLARQWQLIRLLGRPGGLMVADAASELRCAVRTVWRDLQVLQDVGFPLLDERADDGRRGVWKIAPEFHDRLPVPFSLPEVVALLLSRDLLAPAGASLFADAVQSAFAKFRALLTPPAAALIDRMRESVGARVLSAKLQLVAAEHVSLIHEALSERRPLRLRYYSMSRDAETDRRVDPYHLTYFNGGAYLVGHCHLRGEVRMFAVERIRRVQSLRGTFAPPTGFDIQEFLRHAWGLIRGDVVDVTVVFARGVAPYIRERLWHSSQELRELDGGRLELRLRVADTLEVRRWLLGFGADAEVLSPSSLRDALRAEAERLAAMLATARKPPASVRARSRGRTASAGRRSG